MTLILKVDLSTRIECHTRRQEFKEWGTDGLPKSSDTALRNNIHNLV